MMSCIIIDDEPLACEVLENYLCRLDFAAIAGAFSNTTDAAAYLQINKADVMLLDIEMPGMSGIKFLRELTNPPLTIFTTAYRDYAFDGYELGVVDFLLKPISFERFKQAMEKIKDFLLLKAQNSLLERDNQSLGSVFVKSGVQRIKLNFDEVTHIQGLKDYAIVYHAGGKVVIKGSVKSMSDIFPGKYFIRVHKSFIVAKNKILRVEKSKVILKHFQIPVGRTYKDDIDKYIATRE
jgi:DNA-binding LytR/AlgR family response regulator